MSARAALTALARRARRQRISSGSNASAVAFCVFVVGCVFFAGAAVARRAPGPGGTVIVSVPPEWVTAVVEAHVFAPLLIPRGLETGAAAPDRPPLPGAEAWSSTTLDSVDVDAKGQRWTLACRAPPSVVKEGVERCLGAGAGADRERESKSFPVLALRAAGVTSDVVVDGNNVVVSFSKPVFVLPDLLAFCPLRAAGNAPTGAYAVSGPGRLAWRSGSYDAPPLLGAIEVRGATAGQNADRADVVVNPGASAESSSGATLLSPWPDVVVLVQGVKARDDDPFGLEDKKAGTRAFRNALRADLLAAAWASGRGGPTEALLPPGVAPARPLPPSQGVDRAPLALRPVPKDAPRVPLLVRGGESAADLSGDLVLEGVAERLAVLLRARGLLLEMRRSPFVAAGDTPPAAGTELVRWHPPTQDASLALLSFLGGRPELLDNPAVKRSLDVAGLLGKDPAARLAAALALERALLDSRLVVPLLVVDRFLVVDPDLRGVVVRGDGVPLLDGAWWGGGGGGGGSPR